MPLLPPDAVVERTSHNQTVKSHQLQFLFNK
ncbi:putative lipo domain protein, partial [Vibrio parahaemolyticus V-223/04]